MRSLAVPFLCVVLVFFLWCASLAYTAGTRDELSASLDETYVFVSAQDWESASDSYESFQKIWERCSRIYSYYMNTTSVEEIDLAVARCSGYIDMKDGGSACGELADISERLNLIRRESVFSAENIF